MPRSPNSRTRLRSEDVIQVSGRVAARVPGTENPKLATGEIEVVPSELKILNRAEDLPFQLDAETHNEDLRLTYRYFDLRRPHLSRNLRLRHKRHQSDARLSRPPGIRRSRDADSFQKHAGRRARLSCPEPAHAREVLRPATGASAIQTTAYGWRAWKNISRSRNVSRRRSARRSATRIHPDRHRSSFVEPDRTFTP